MKNFLNNLLVSLKLKKPTYIICSDYKYTDLSKFKNKSITIWAPDEVTPNGFVNDRMLENQKQVVLDYQKFQDTCIEHNIDYKLILGARNPIFHHKTWNNFFAYYTIANSPKDIKIHYMDKPLVCMNGRMTNQRCKFIDQFAKEGLIDYSYFTAHNNFQDTEWLNYNWQHWEPKVTVLEDVKDWKNRPPAHKIPDFYTKGACIVGTESKDHLIFITEKFYNPTYYKRPSLLYSCKDYYYTLWKKGYKPLDGIDYAFDSEGDNEKRLKMYMKQVRLISKRDPNKFYQKQKDILEYNRNNMMKEVLYSVVPEDLPPYYKKIVEKAKTEAEKNYSEDWYNRKQS